MDKTLLIGIILTALTLVVFFGCKQKVKAKKEEPIAFKSEVVHPEWTKNINVYEVNVRQFTEEATFKAFESHLPRLQELGIDVLWFMPIHPIGVKNRKGELGSYYSVKDYMDVNPEFGNLDDFKELLDKAHDLGFHVIIDWVPNHTSWDNPLALENPEWYIKDSTGSFIPPLGTDWTDVIQLDWSQQGLQDYMIEAFTFWVNMGVDGFRVDHPHKTPYEFWDRARMELDKIKPVLMLAENEDQLEFMEKGFDMNYAWELHHLMNEVAQGKKNTKELVKYFEKENKKFPSSIYRLRFMTNHDENSWAGTINERMGEAQKAMAVFTFTIPGVPLLYGGQEACMDKRLKFFERDPIVWEECELTGFYKDLIQLKKDHEALWNGDYGSPMTMIKTSKSRRVFAFSREKEDKKVIVFLNLSKNPTRIKPNLKTLEGNYTDFTTGNKVELPLIDSLSLGSWDYRILVR